MGAGPKGESASKARSPEEPSERIMRIHYSYPVIDREGGRAGGKASTGCLGFSLAAACLDRTKRRSEANPLGPVVTPLDNTTPL
jgi:hypothetical protein